MNSLYTLCQHISKLPLEIREVIFKYYRETRYKRYRNVFSKVKRPIIYRFIDLIDINPRFNLHPYFQLHLRYGPSYTHDKLDILYRLKKKYDDTQLVSMSHTYFIREYCVSQLWNHLNYNKPYNYNIHLGKVIDPIFKPKYGVQTTPSTTFIEAAIHYNLAENYLNYLDRTIINKTVIDKRRELDEYFHTYIIQRYLARNNKKVDI